MLESVLASVDRIATPRRQNMALNTRHTNAEIEQLVLAKRRSRREWQLLRSPSAKQQLNEASRRLTKALRQEEDRSQQRNIEQLSPSSSKFPLWKPHSTLHSGPACMGRAAKNTSSCYIVSKFSPKFFKNILIIEKKIGHIARL